MKISRSTVTWRFVHECVWPTRLRVSRYLLWSTHISTAAGCASFSSLGRRT